MVIRVFLFITREVIKMTEKEDRKEFVEPKLSKFEEPLDEVTLLINCYDNFDACNV